MTTVKLNECAEGRQTTIKHIIKVKGQIKSLEKEIKGMVEETKAYLLSEKIELIADENNVFMVAIEPSKSAPSFKQVYESVKDQLPVETQKLLETAFEKGYKDISKIIFNY